MICPCGARAVAQWRRRPTDSELAAIVAEEQARRLSAQTPTDAPLPTAAGTDVPVYGCEAHSLSPELASLMHQSSCAAPVPGCDCTPEPGSAGDPM